MKPRLILFTHVATRRTSALFPLKLAPGSTLAELRVAVHELTGVEPEQQTALIYKGKTVTATADPATAIAALGINNRSKVVVMGTKRADVEAMWKGEAADSRRHEARKRVREQRPLYGKSQPNGPSSPCVMDQWTCPHLFALSSPPLHGVGLSALWFEPRRLSDLTSVLPGACRCSYVFQTCRVLENMPAGAPSPAEARAYLQRICDDNGVRAIMEKHKWCGLSTFDAAPTPFPATPTNTFNIFHLVQHEI